MKLEIDKFGGIIPGTDESGLPHNAAQTARNIDLSGGTIKPWSTTNNFTRLHDDAGNMLPGFPAASIAKISKPSKVTLTSLTSLFNNPSGAISITVHMYMSYINNNGVFAVLSKSGALTITKVTRSASGFTLHGSINPADFVFTLRKGVRYTASGPIYRVSLSNSVALGGSDTALNFPETVSFGSAQLPSFSAPIYSTANGRPKYQYGTLEAVDVNGPSRSGVYEVPEPEPADVVWLTTNVTMLSGAVQMVFECNYIRNTNERVYYVQQSVDSSGRDGPESDVSDEIIIPPGMFATLDVPGAGTKRLFRSANSESGFALLKEFSATTYVDDFRDSLSTDLPPNGNIPHTTTALAVAGAVQHPAGYFVYFFEKDLRPSSEWIDFPRPWAVPTEYAHTFDSNISCIALAGDTILVFTQTAVYRAHGQHPGRLAIYRISDKPILNKLTLWQDGVQVGWCDIEGLNVFDGGSGQLLTGEYMRADKWNAFTPANFKAQVNDKAVCLFDGAANLRFDFRGDRSAAISTFTVTNGTVPAFWRSKRFGMPKPTAWYACRIVATGYPVTMRLFADGVEVAHQDILDESDRLLPRMPKAWHWEIEVETMHEVRQIALATNRREL